MLLLMSCCLAAYPWSTPAPPSVHARWVVVASDGRSAIEVDRLKVERAHARVALRVRARAPVDSVVEEFEQAGVEPAAIERLRARYDHSEHRWSFDCVDRTHALLHSTYFDRDRAPIRAFDVDAPQWWPVHPATVGATLLQVACSRDGRMSGHDEPPWQAQDTTADDTDDGDANGR